MGTTGTTRATLAIPLQPILLSQAHRLAANDADARDLVQDTMERVLRTPAVPTNDFEFRRWVRRVMTNLWIDRVRARNARRHVPFCDQGVNPEALGATSDSTDRPGGWRDLSVVDVARALEDVPEPFRSAFQGHVFEHRSYVELAREMGIRPATIGTRVLRARRQLRDILQGRLRVGRDRPVRNGLKSCHDVA